MELDDDIFENISILTKKKFIGRTSSPKKKKT
jgi:hypothetical protein